MCITSIVIHGRVSHGRVKADPLKYVTHLLTMAC